MRDWFRFDAVLEAMSRFSDNIDFDGTLRKRSRVPRGTCQKACDPGTLFSSGFKNHFSPFFAEEQCQFPKKKVKSDCKYGVNAPTHSSFCQFSDETKHDCLALTVNELELF